MLSAMQAMAKTTTSVAERSGRPAKSSSERQDSTSAKAATMRDSMALAHRALTRTSAMRSPNRPRGRNSSTSSISEIDRSFDPRTD